MGTNRIDIGMGEGVVATGSHVVSSEGIGSCVVVTLYDCKRRAGGMAHVMLPGSGGVPGPAGAFQCADTAVEALLEGLRCQGSLPRDIVAKMAGGAQMFSSYENETTCIGGQIVRSLKDVLKRERIPLVGWDVASHHGRSVEFHLASGKLIVKAIGLKDREF